MRGYKFKIKSAIHDMYVIATKSGDNARGDIKAELEVLFPDSSILFVGSQEGYGDLDIDFFF